VDPKLSNISSSFKGIVSWDKYFFNTLKFETVLFELALMVFTMLVVFCVGNPKWSFCLLLWKQLLIVKFLPVTLFRELVPAFWLPPVILKIVPKAGYECSLEKTDPMRARESLKRNLMRLSEQLLELVKRSKQKLHIDFSLELSRLKI
jgi:hypothetical protein